MSPNTQNMSCRAMPCQAGARASGVGPASDASPGVDIRGLDLAAGLVFAVLLGLAALVVCSSVVTGDALSARTASIEAPGR